MGQTRRSSPRAYQCCQACRFRPDYPGATACQAGYDLYYKRISKKNGCEKCAEELERIWKERVKELSV